LRMAIKPKIETAFNNHMNKEFYSYYLYISLAAHFESANLKGFAHWLRIQANEELGHAMKFYDHLLDRGGKVTLKPIESPQSKWKSHEEAFQSAYEHERKVTEAINQLSDLAKSEKDHAAEVFLQWFVNEQVEEELIANEIVQKIGLIGDEGSALLMLDAELGKRSAE